MTVDLNALSATQLGPIAAAATLVAAVAAAIAAYVVAKVNARAAASLERESARRAHRLRTITPFLDFLDERVAQYQELMKEGPRLSATLSKVSAALTLPIPAQPQTIVAKQVQGANELDAFQQRATDLTKRITASNAAYDTGWPAFMSSDQKISDRGKDWLKNDLAFMRAFAVSGLTTNPEKLKQFTELLFQARDKAVSCV